MAHDLQFSLTPGEDPTKYILQQWVSGEIPVAHGIVSYDVDLAANGHEVPVMVMTVHLPSGKKLRRSFDLDDMLRLLARDIYNHPQLDP